MYEAGGWVLVESALADLPGDLRWLYESGAVTIEQLAAIHRALGSTSAADLAAARRASSGSARFPASTPTSRPRSRAALPTLRAHDSARAARPRATAVAEPVLERLRARAWRRVGAAGRVAPPRAGHGRRHRDRRRHRRSRPTPSPNCSRVPDRRACCTTAERRLYLLIERDAGRRPPAGAGERRRDAALPDRIGRAFRGAARRTPSRRGWRLTRRGTARARRHAAAGSRLRTRSTRRSACRSIPPEIRDGADEIVVGEPRRAAARWSRAADIRGDLHMHSLWSDGRDSIEAMVQACVALGYEYLAITDHSPNSAATRNLTADGVKQAGRRDRRAARAVSGDRDPARLRGRHPAGWPARFPGSRCSSGSTSCWRRCTNRPASRPDQLLKRYASAMQHPLVSR